MATWVLWLALGLSQSVYERDLAEARTLLEQNRIEEALEPLGRAHASRPQAPEPLWMLAVAYLRLDRYDEGLPYAEALYRLNTGHVRAGLLLVTYYQRRGEVERALDVCRSLVEVEPRNPQVLHEEAMLALRVDDLERSRAAAVGMASS